MNNGVGLSQPRTCVRTAEHGLVDRLATKKKVIERLKALSPSLVASGAIVDARHSSLETELPPKRRGRFPRK